MSSTTAALRIVTVCYVLMAFLAGFPARELLASGPVALSSFPPSSKGAENENPASSFSMPIPSASFRIPDSYVRYPRKWITFYGDVDAIIRFALERSGYDEYAYYSVPGGFALVTRMEQIRKDGSSMPPPQRWIVNQKPINPFSDFSHYLSSLDRLNPGYYRVIVFIVSSDSVVTGHAEPKSRDMVKRFEDGVTSLPNNVLDRIYAPGDQCIAVIYEFRKSEKGAVPDRPSMFGGGKLHLEKAGIWRCLVY
jgi:hypothetical protein